MDMDKMWDRALKNTEILRSRVEALMTFQATRVPYIFLAESTVNAGDTVVRKGEVVVEKPAIILPPNIPQFEGFEFGPEAGGREDDVINFLMVRGVAMPSLKYNNKTHSLDIYEGKLNKAVREYLALLQHQENVRTGLVTGPEDCWQFSILIFICSQIARNANSDIQKLLERYRKKKGRS